MQVQTYYQHAANIYEHAGFMKCFVQCRINLYEILSHLVQLKDYKKKYAII